MQLASAIAFTLGYSKVNLFNNCKKLESNYILVSNADLPTSSTVQGIVTKDGLFDGHISTSVDDYYIEPASRYFGDINEDSNENEEPKSRPFHSVIYKASDVSHPLDPNSEVRT